METTKYLIVGSSHAALEAINAIRRHDAEGSVTVATRDAHLPYSPTVLPYVVSGKSAADKVQLRDDDFFARERVAFRRGAALTALHAERKVAEFADGGVLSYDKILLATGAAPVVPPIPGLDSVKFHVLRTLDDALGLHAAIGGARRAVVLGGGLVGMHAAENLVKAGAEVTVVEMNAHVLAAYFDPTASTMIERAFAEHGARVMTGRRVVAVAPAAGQGSGTHPGGHGAAGGAGAAGAVSVMAGAARSAAAAVTLDDDTTLDADLLLVATGVRPELGYLNGSGVAHEAGILVDDSMRTSVADVFAAGDCAQAKDFYADGKTVNAILPTAAEQGRIAGMAMAGDPGVKAYAGGVPLNTYHFFGQHAISVGSSAVPAGAEVLVRGDADSGRYLKAIFHDGRLRGMFGINEYFDGGVMWQLILRRIDLSACRDRLFADPLAVGRELMSKHWR